MIYIHTYKEIYTGGTLNFRKKIVRHINTHIII